MDTALLIANGITIAKIIGLVAVALFGAQVWVLLANLAGSIKDSRWRNIALTVVHAIQQQYEGLTGAEKANMADAALAKVLKGSTEEQRRTLMEAAVLVMKSSGTATKSADLTTVADQVAAAKASADKALAEVGGLARALRGGSQ